MSLHKIFEIPRVFFLPLYSLLNSTTLPLPLIPNSIKKHVFVMTGCYRYTPALSEAALVHCLEAFQSNSARNIATIHRIAFPARSNIKQPTCYIMNVECNICILTEGSQEKTRRSRCGKSLAAHKYWYRIQ